MADRDRNKGGAFWDYLSGGTVFISHSHKDLPKVRLIRNYLEEKGFDPLCFFMQCLTDEDEINGLLKREIDARDWFAFMESENSLQSAWVRKERDYIQSIPNKKVLHYKLYEDSPKDIANQIMDDMTVYFCYSGRDREYGSAIAKSLSTMDFRVYKRWDDEIKDIHYYFSPEYQRLTEEAIKKAAKHGCFLFLMTRFSAQAQLMWKELEYARDYGARIAVAFLGISPWEIPAKLDYLISSASCAELNGIGQDGVSQIASLVGQTLLSR